MTPQPGSAIVRRPSWKAPRQPMLWAALAYGAGIVLGVHTWRPASWWILAGFVFALSAAYLVQRRSGIAWCLALSTFLLAGALHVQVRSASGQLDPSILDFADRQSVQLSAHVIKDGQLHEELAGESRQTVDIELDKLLNQGGSEIATHSRIRLGIYGSRKKDGEFDETSIRSFRYGERIQCVARLRRPRNFRNPGAFDYQGYLAERGIVALGSAKLEDTEILPGFIGNRIEALRSRLHRSVLATVHQLWRADDAALIDAMIIGDDALIDRPTRTEFQRSGTYHVLVVSGMNVSILAFVVFWTLRRLRLNDIASTLLTIAVCVGYAFVTDVGAPVWRATVMCTVYLLIRLLYRDRGMLNAVGAAALALLVYDPRQIFSASFQMTFVCVLIVGAIGLPILQRTSQHFKQALQNWDATNFAAYLPPDVAQFRVDLRLVAARLALFIPEKWAVRIVCGTVSSIFAAWELVFISAVMQIGLALPMAYYFHRATTLGLPANLLIVPLTQLMMPSAVAALALGYVSPWIAKLPVLLTTISLRAISGTVHGLGALQLAELRVALPTATTIVLSAIALAFAMWSARRRFLIAVAGLSAILATAFVLAFIPPPPQIRNGVLEMTSIDVGQGDSSLVITPQGKMLLVDAGGPIGPAISQFDFGEDVVSPYLWSRGISRLDAVAITHGHSDHAGGMIAVLKNFRPAEIWVGLEPPSTLLSNILSAAKQLNIKVVRRWEGDHFQFGGAEFDVLYPARNADVGDKPSNNDSLIMHASYGTSSVLLQGDAGKRVERYVTAIHHPAATLLKVGHHGSSNATTPELIDSAKPRFAVISVGWGNSFGLPRPETLTRLATSGARVYRTDLDGAVTFYLDQNSATVSVAALQ